MTRITTALSLLALALTTSARAEADCPADDRIRNLRYVGGTWTSPRRVSYAWDTPRGPSSLTVYEVLVASRPDYCSPSPAFTVRDETVEPRYTLELDEPDRVYAFAVRVKGCPFIRSEATFLDDSFHRPPSPPALEAASTESNSARLSFSSPDPRALHVGLERAAEGGGYVEVRKVRLDGGCAVPPAVDSRIPRGRYRYRAFAFNQGTLDRTYSQPVEVEVLGVPAPRVVRFSATPALVTAGAPVTLTWETEGATGASLTAVGGVLAQGSTTVQPTETTEYTLLAEGPGGQTEARLRVTVVGSRRPDLVVPAVTSAPGRNGAFFRTAVQVSNPGAEVSLGRLVFRPSGGSDSTADPFVTFRLQPGETLAIDPLLPALGVEGSGSLEVYRDRGALPVVTARIASDAPGGGTNGLLLEALSVEEALSPATGSLLLVPADTVRYRFNLGMRALHEGATVKLVLRRGDGAPAAEAVRRIPPAGLLQEGAAELFGTSLAGNESVSVSVLDGAAFVLGMTADNATNDPQVQVARRRAERG